MPILPTTGSARFGQLIHESCKVLILETPPKASSGHNQKKSNRQEANDTKNTANSVEVSGDGCTSLTEEQSTSYRNLSPWEILWLNRS